ncbi:MAG: ATP-binding protein [Hyphomicrobiaceae bacterium]|nr:ATP-binding protein [Hyphomicrobiaceae bacterium]
MTYLPIFGFGIVGYRSFFGEPQLVGPCGHVNIFIGENNCGKSNILRFIRDVYQNVGCRSGQLKAIRQGDAPQGGAVGDTIQVMLPASDEILQRLNGELVAAERLALLKIIRTDRSRNVCIVSVSLSTNRPVVDVEAAAARLTDHNENLHVNRAWSRVTRRSGGSMREHWIPEIVEWFYNTSVQGVRVEYVPTLRQIPTKLEEFKFEYGVVTKDKTIADDLAALAYPDHTRPRDRVKFEAIVEFMRKVLKRPQLLLSVPHDKSTIIIEDHGRYLPVEALGTGIHQLLILAIRAILVDDCVVCIEEPELHLHPELQQQLMHFLASQTANQYFITTHSATIMDAVNAKVFSVRLVDNSSKIDAPLTRSDRRDVCHQLGYRPSDLLQANSVIWVEGPTDRIYVVNWLKSVAPFLEEGWHYSVMFYGGRLASHLTVDDEARELIDLLPINRFPAIILDSDKRKKGQQLNSTKRRLCAEFEKINGFSWVTEGREIENYVPYDIREQTLKALVGEKQCLLDQDLQYGHPLAYHDGSDENVPDKLRMAIHMCESPLNLAVLDLRKRVTDLAQYICQANRIAFVDGTTSK